MRDANRLEGDRVKRLEGLSAVVTGASSGIGRATAKALAAEGASVGLAARRTAELDVLADEIIDDGGHALAIETDVARRDQIERMIDRAVDAFGRLDILVNNAGVADWSHVGIVDGNLDRWQEEIEVNLLGVMTSTRLAAQHMAGRERGHIVNVSSLAGRSYAPHFPGYGTSKWGTNAFSMMAMHELGKKGVRVTLIEPGEVATPMQPEEDLKNMRMLDPQDVADAIVYAVTRPPHVCVSDIQIVLTR